MIFTKSVVYCIPFKFKYLDEQPDYRQPHQRHDNGQPDYRQLHCQLQRRPDNGTRFPKSVRLVVL